MLNELTEIIQIKMMSNTWGSRISKYWAQFNDL